MAENLNLVRQAIQTIKNEVEDGANTAARVGSAMSSILEYGKEQTDAEIERATDAEKVLNANAGISSYPTFSTASAYAVGDAVMYEGKMYEFITAHPAGNWNSSHVVQTSVKDRLNKQILANKDAIVTLNANTGISEYSTFSSSTDYATGDVVLYDGRLYRFTADHAAGEWIGTDVQTWSEKKEREEIVTELESEVKGFSIKGESTSEEQNILKSIVSFEILSKDTTPKSFKLLQTGSSDNEGYEDIALFYLIGEDKVYYFTAKETDKTGVKRYSSVFKEYTLNVTFDWGTYNSLFANRYAPKDLNYGTDGLYTISIYDERQDVIKDYALTNLFTRDSYLGDNERKFLECIEEYSISTPSGGDKFKILQTGRSSSGIAIFFVKNVITGDVCNFGFTESEYVGVKSYNIERDSKRLKITINWSKLFESFPNYYSPTDVTTTNEGLYVISTNNSLNDIDHLEEKIKEECGILNKFNGNIIVGDAEAKLAQCLQMYKVVTLEKPIELKILQTGFSNSMGKVIFFVGIRNEDDTLSPLNLVPNESATSVDELSGIKRYETKFNHKDIGLIEQVVVIDWDKYKSSFSDRYSPTSVTEFSGNRLCVISDMKTDVSEINEDLSLAVRDVEKVSIVAFEQTPISEYFRNQYVVYNVPFERNGILESINTEVYPHDYTTMQLTLLIGEIDQRGWLVNPRTYSYSFAELGIPEGYVSNDFTINLTDKFIQVNKGEVLCFYSRRYDADANGKSFLIARNGTDSDKVLVATTIDGVFEPYKEFTKLSYKVKYFDSDFAKEESVKELESNLAALGENLNISSILTDLSTGSRYRLVVNNGSIQLKSLDYKKALFIGSSFVNHGISEEVGWFRKGAMAPSVNTHSLPQLTFTALKNRSATFEGNIMGSSSWERNYNTSFDFDVEWKPTLLSENPDVIFMHISGNSTWTDEFESACELMIENVKKTCPLADVFIAASWHGGQKAVDMRTACKNKGAVYVDLSLYKVQSSMWKAGDWYYAEDDGQYHGIYEVVTTHPNDMGCLLQANAFLRSAGYDEIKKTHHITINASSGIIATTPNNVWPEDGIVTVRIESGNVSLFSVSKKSGDSVAYTQRNNDLNTSYNTYFTFTMPNEDVVVNIS